MSLDRPINIDRCWRSADTDISIQRHISVELGLVYNGYSSTGRHHKNQADLS